MDCVSEQFSLCIERISIVTCTGKFAVELANSDESRLRASERVRFASFVAPRRLCCVVRSSPHSFSVAGRGRESSSVSGVVHGFEMHFVLFHGMGIFRRLE